MLNGPGDCHLPCPSIFHISWWISCTIWAFFILLQCQMISMQDRCDSEVYLGVPGRSTTELPCGSSVESIWQHQRITFVASEQRSVGINVLGVGGPTGAKVINYCTLRSIYYYSVAVKYIFDCIHSVSIDTILPVSMVSVGSSWFCFLR